MPAGNPMGYNTPGDPSSGVKPEASTGGNPIDALKAIQNAMTSLLEGAGDKLPKEALDALESSVEAYNQFLSIVTGTPQQEGKAIPMNQAPAMAGGAKAVPVG